MKNKKIVYLVYNEETVGYDLVDENVVDEKLSTILEIKHKRKIMIGDLKLQVLRKEEFSNHDRYYLYSYDCNKTDITWYIHTVLITESIINHMKKLNEIDLIDFHDSLYQDAVSEYECRMTEKMLDEYYR